MDLTVFMDNLPSLIVMAIFLTITTLINNGYLSKLFKRKGRGKTVAEIAERMDKMEGDFVPNLDGILKRIEDKIDAMSDRVCEMEKRLNFVDKSALMGVIYNRHIHVIDRLRAFNSYLKLGGNGLVAKFALEKLVLPNSEHWIRAVQESHMKIYCEKYEERIAEIDKKIQQGE